jgi:hypothetical protein
VVLSQTDRPTRHVACSINRRLLESRQNTATPVRPVLTLRVPGCSDPKISRRPALDGGRSMALGTETFYSQAESILTP